MKPGKIYICAGKLGDQINLLPLLWADAQKGDRPTLLVAKEFAGQISEGCSYFDELVFDGPADAIKDAYNFARGFVDDADIVVTQIVGKPEDAKWAYGRINTTHSQTESFAKEAYLLAGRMADWGKFPLVFDKRGHARERELVKHVNVNLIKGESAPIILVSFTGKSSPFLHNAALLDLLKLRFSYFNIVNLPTFAPSRIYDLLALYERAHVLVATDSAPLHLAYACPNLPVVALVNDKPLLWNGSPWRPNHIAHIRYSDFRARILDIWDAIEGIGKPGSKFNPKLDNLPRWIHAWSAYEMNDEAKNIEARKTWLAEYAANQWIECCARPGVFGRDSKSNKISEKRYPFLKDVIRMAARLARDEDKIVLTRQDTSFVSGISGPLTIPVPCYAHRKARGNDDYDPFIDLISFPKKWWVANHAQMPELIMNNDNQWATVLVELLKVTGGVTELKDAIYRV